jgi:hypothetical protein
MADYTQEELIELASRWMPSLKEVKNSYSAVFPVKSSPMAARVPSGWLNEGINN